MHYNDLTEFFMFFFLYCQHSLIIMLTCSALLRVGGHKFCSVSIAWNIVYLFAEELTVFRGNF